MKEKFQLSSKEKIIQSILRLILVLVFMIISKGIYNQNNNIDEDNILFPAFLIISEFFCILYFTNAFNNGNLVKNWAGSITFYNVYTFYTKSKGYNDDIASKKTIRFFGFFSLIIAIILPLLAIMFYKKII